MRHDPFLEAFFLEPPRGGLLAAIFATDLVAAAGRVHATMPERVVVETIGGQEASAVTLPITIPVDPHGVVVLSTGHVDAPRHPAQLVVVLFPAPPTRRRARGPGNLRYRAGFELSRPAGELLRIPGIRSGPGLAEMGSVAVGVSDRGMAVKGRSLQGGPLDLDLDEATAGLLATALLITVGVKLAKAERGELW